MLRAPSATCTATYPSSVSAGVSRRYLGEVRRAAFASPLAQWESCPLTAPANTKSAGSGGSGVAVAVVFGLDLAFFFFFADFFFWAAARFGLRLAVLAGLAAGARRSTARVTGVPSSASLPATGSWRMTTQSS